MSRIQRKSEWLKHTFRIGGPGFNWLFVGLAVLVTVMGVLFGLCFWSWIRDGSESAESNGATLRNVGLLIGGGLALVFALWRSLVAGHQADAAQRQAKVTQNQVEVAQGQVEVAQGQVEVAQQQADVAQQSLLNERYQKGAEMLGSDVLSVRMGGIYALRRLAEDNPEQYHVQIMELLCAFVRYPKFDEELDKQAPTLRTDVQDVMQAIGSRSPERISLERSEDFKLYLRDAKIRHLQIRGARLSGAWLTKADLSGATLPYADLSSARLRRAILTGVDFRHANLTDAKFWGANLSKAKLFDANLSGADLCGIDARSTAYKQPVCNFTQAQLDEAVADCDNPPKLEGVLDAETGEQLVWRGGVPNDEPT